MKLITYFLIINFAVLSIYSLNAQRSEFTKSSFITLSLQSARDGIQDQKIQIPEYFGTVNRYNFRYERIQENTNRWFAELNCSHFGLNFGKPNLDVDNKQPYNALLMDNTLKIAWSKKIATLEKFGIHVGPQINSKFILYNVDGIREASWLSAQNIELMIRAFLPIVTRQNLELSFTYPLLGIVGRPNADQDHSFGYVNPSYTSREIIDLVYSNQKGTHGFKFINPEVQARYTYTFGKIGLIANLYYEYLFLGTNLDLKRSTIGGEFGVYLKI